MVDDPIEVGVSLDQRDIGIRKFGRDGCQDVVGRVTEPNRADTGVGPTDTDHTEWALAERDAHCLIQAAPPVSGRGHAQIVLSALVDPTR